MEQTIVETSGITSIEPLEQAYFYSLCALSIVVPWKIAPAEICLGISTLIWIALSWKHKKIFIPRTALILPILFFVIVNVLSIFYGINQARSTQRIFHFWLLIAILLPCSGFINLKQLQTLLYLYIGGLTAKAIYGSITRTIEIYHGSNPFDPGSMTESGLLLMGIGLVLAWLLYEQDKNKFKWLSIALLFLTISLVLNFKRGSWMGVFIICLVLGRARSWKVPVAAIALAIVILIVYHPARDRLMQLTKQNWVIDEGRAQMWALVPQIFREYPFGVGIANAPVIMQRYNPTLIGHNHFHNNFLQILVETGIPGLMIFLWWMGTYLWLTFDTYQQQLKRQNGLFWTSTTLAIFAIIIGFLSNGLVEYNFGDSEVVLMFFFLTGALLMIRNSRNSLS